MNLKSSHTDESGIALNTVPKMKRSNRNLDMIEPQSKSGASSISSSRLDGINMHSVFFFFH